MDPLSQLFVMINPLAGVWEAWSQPDVGFVGAIFYSALSLVRFNPLAILAYVALLYWLVNYLFQRWRRQLEARARTPVPRGTDAPLSADEDDNGVPYFDVAIAGAGPAGSACAFFLARERRYRVALFEAKEFTRIKPCGDAVCKIAIEILSEMGLFQELVDTQQARVADIGGLCGPSHESFVGSSHGELGEVPAALAIRRSRLDAAMARRAVAVGAHPFEQRKIASAKFVDSLSLWELFDENSALIARSRVLVCADGSKSYLAKSLGLHDTQPQGIGTSHIMPPGTHNCDIDGIVLYEGTLPTGYAGYFLHPDPKGVSREKLDGELMLTTYIIETTEQMEDDLRRLTREGPMWARAFFSVVAPLLKPRHEVKQGDLGKWHQFFLHEHPIGRKWVKEGADIGRPFNYELRVRQIPKMHARALCVVGDAAGLIDPLTGEGIHCAMESGKICGLHLVECLNKGNLSEAAMRGYEDKVQAAFGFDAEISRFFARVIARFPILQDAAVRALQKGGEPMLARWAEIMTGRTPKIELASFRIGGPVFLELLPLMYQRWKNPEASANVSAIKKKNE